MGSITEYIAYLTGEEISEFYYTHIKISEKLKLERRKYRAELKKERIRLLDQLNKEGSGTL